MIEPNIDNNLIIVYYARPKDDYFPCWSDCCEDWKVDTAANYDSTGETNEEGLFDSLLSAGLPRIQCEKVFDLASNRNIDLDVAECIWGNNFDNRPSDKTTTQVFDDLNNDLSVNNIPVKFVCNWIF